MAGILGASPDGIVDEHSVLEAKCPYIERKMTIEEAMNTPSNFYLKKTESSQNALKEEHVYNATIINFINQIQTNKQKVRYDAKSNNT